MNRLAVIVLNWNGSDDAIECIESLTEQTLKPTIIIVDNNSSDNSVSVFEKYISIHKREDITLIKNPDNFGFAGGINTGLVYAKEHNFEYIGVLNPDAIADKKWCQVLVDELSSQPKYGIATGILQRRDGKTLDTTGDFYTTWGLPGPRNRDEPVKNAPSKPGEVFGATGGGAIYRAAIFDDIDMFDEDFFMYYEDVDISFRAQLAGFRVRYTPRAIAYHKQGASSQKVPGLTVYNTFKNLPLLAYKNLPTGLLWSVLPRFWLAYWLFYFNAIRRGNGWAATKGIGASLRLLPYCIAYRHKNRRARIVTVKYIRSLIYDGLPPVESGLQRLIHPFKSRRSKA